MSFEQDEIFGSDKNQPDGEPLEPRTAEWWESQKHQMAKRRARFRAELGQQNNRVSEKSSVDEDERREAEPDVSATIHDNTLRRLKRLYSRLEARSGGTP